MVESDTSPAAARRQLALERMERAATFLGSADRSWRIIDGVDYITLIGSDAEGREFRVSYQPETPEERARRTES